MPTPDVCPQCGSAIPRGAPEGLCMGCLLHAGTAEPDAADDLPRKFGNYSLERLLGRGGAGLVFAARQDGLDRRVAVKVLAAGMFADRAGRERFRAEAQAVAGMDHPGIVPVLEAGEYDGQAFFTMPLLAEGSLAEALARGQSFSGPEAAAFAEALARAVHYAHQRGVLHRDIKPGNILLTAAGEPRLTDFGLARLLEKESSLTRTNALLGTPAYMAPEQAQCGTVTTATDVYGMGAVLYELLTGQPPFAGGTSVQTVRLLVDTEPRRPSALNPRVDRDLETICLKCLDKNPAQRYGSAEALADDLGRYRSGMPVSARPVGTAGRIGKWARRHPAPAASIAVASLAIVSAAVIATLLSLRLEKARRDTAVLSEQRRHEVARLHAEECAVQLARHDAVAAFAAAVEALATEEAALPGALRDAAVRRARERVATVQSRCPDLLREWTHDAPTRDGVFSPDGSAVLVRSADALHFYDGVSGEPRLPSIDTGPSDRGWMSGSLRWSPDGKRIAVDVTGPEPFSHAVRVLDASSGHWLWPAALPCFGRFGFSPDGTRVLLASALGTAWFAAEDGRQMATVREGECLEAAASPDGRLVAVCDGAAAVFIHDAATGALLHGPLNASGELTRYPVLAWSPDSHWLGEATVGSHSTRAALWKFPGATPVEPLVANGGVTLPLFSPDSTRWVTIGFEVSRVRPLSAAEPPGDVLKHPGLLLDAAWSPDGKLIAAASTHGVALFWDAKGSEETVTRLHHASQVNSVAWSPDGRRLLTTGNDGKAKLWALPLGNPATLTVSSGGGFSRLTWSADGREIHARIPQGTAVLDAQTGSRLRDLDVGANLPPQTVFSPDGRLCAVPEQKGGRFEIRDAATQAVKHSLRHPGGESYWHLGLRFSPDGRRLVSFGGSPLPEACAAEVWDVETGRPAGFRLRHLDDIFAADFSADGQWIATAGVDAVPRLWHAADGSSAGEFARHGYWIWDVRFSADSTRLATASADHTARVWDVRNFTAITPPFEHGRIVSHLAWHPDGTQLATVDSAGTLSLWNVRPDARPLEQLRSVVQRLLPASPN